jgi:nucleotide-binding universal stress UspA family protein
MYRTIVVGTDGSKTASAAVDHAALLAKSVGATLHIIHAYKPMSSMMPMDPLIVQPDPVMVQRELEDHAKGICVQAADRARAAGAETVTHVSGAKDPAEALVTLAEHLNADLMVVGNKGMAGVRRFITGSVPNRVAHHCPCHLLVVATSGAEVTDRPSHEADADADADADVDTDA